MRKLLWVLVFGVARLSDAAAPEHTVNMTPIIGDLPTPVVANDTPVTGAGIFGSFVYMDALDLNTLATDDLTPSAQLMWTYTGGLASGGSRYRLNGVNPINVATMDPTSPTTALIINRNDLDPVPAKDTYKNTITIRNNHLSPISGTGGSLPSSNGIVASETEPITFFCSDGNSFSSQTVFFYTDNGGNDRLSAGPSCRWWFDDKLTKFWRKAEWNVLGATGTNFQMTTTTVPGVGAGVCLVAGLKGWNWGALVSAYPYFNLAANQVYQLKLKMVGSQATGGKTPYWDLTWKITMRTCATRR